MNKLYSTLLVCVLGFSFAIAQTPTFSLVESTATNVAIVNNQIFDLTTNPALTTASNFLIRNLTATTQSYSVFKNENVLHTISVTDKAEASFCTGATCYPPTVMSAIAVVPSNSTIAFIADLLEASTLGQSNVSYDISNVNNGLEQLTVVFRYNFAMSVRANSIVFSNTSDVYPNPSSDKAFIDLSTDQELNGTTLNVYNALGSLVSTKQITLNKGKNTITIDNSHLNSGIYFANIVNGSSVITKKITINK